MTEVNDVEIYDATGKLLSITKPTGLKTALTYNANGQLSTVTDPFGRQLSFNYDGVGRISQISDASGGTYAYSYDLKGNLRAVNYPNGVAKTYHYENTAFPSALTGITDENGIRYATYAYDVTGRAISTQHAGGAEHYILSFGTNSTVVTDPLNTNRTDTFQIILGVAKHTGSSQPGGSGCGPAASALTYDPNNGNIATRTDFNGNLTTYDYDLTRNLEKKRVEASGKPETRTISTQWHAYWRLPTKVAEPKKLSTWVYNGDTDPSTGSVLTCAPSSATVPSITGGTVPIGVLCKQSEQSTTDANGSTGFTATVSGLPRTWTYTYNAYGQVLTADGPRTDVSDVTTTTYYAPTDPDLGKRGNLATVTNALGHVTQITAYDLNGNPLTIIDPNNVTTTLTYTPRGWLKSRTVGTELTGYKYDDVGQLTRVTQPDASTLTFTYDDAHRLTDLTDNLGNTVHYTLDAAGNRRNETIKDPWGTLTRQITRVYDALGRLQTVTGARQ